MLLLIIKNIKKMLTQRRKYEFLLSIEKRRMLILRGGGRRNSHRMIYDTNKHVFYNPNVSEVQKTLLEKVLLFLIGFIYGDLHIKSRIDELTCHILILGKNQFHVIDTVNRRIAHFLIESCDDVWFRNNIKVHNIIYDRDYNVKIPKIIKYDLPNTYYVTDYLSGGGFSELGNENRCVIFEKLLQFYVSQPELMKKNAYLEFERIKGSVYDELIRYSEFETSELLKIIHIVFDKIGRIINENRSMDVCYTLISHGDMNYKENIIVRPNGELFFIDWEMSRSSNVLYDYFYMLIFQLNQVDEKIKLLSEDAQNKQYSHVFSLFSEYMKIKLDMPAYRVYFCLTVSEMLLYKIRILHKKRCGKITREDRMRRFTSISNSLAMIQPLIESSSWR